MELVRDPAVIESLDKDIEYMERVIKNVMERVPERNLDGARRQVSLLREARAKYIEAMAIQPGPLTVPVTTNPGTCGNPSHYAPKKT